jgi:hypothetical protein
MITTYFGLIRYLLLHNYKCQSYIENFKKLDKQNEPIIVTLYTNNPNKITPTINSILDQTIRVDQIKVLHPTNITDISLDIKNVVWIQPVKKNYGELNTIIPTLLAIEEKDTSAIIIKDNIVYGKDFIEDMVKKHSENKNCIIYSKKNKPELGLLVKTNFFKNEFVDSKNISLQNFIDKYKNTNTKSIEYSENYTTFRDIFNK